MEKNPERYFVNTNYCFSITAIRKEKDEHYQLTTRSKDMSRNILCTWHIACISDRQNQMSSIPHGVSSPPRLKLPCSLNPDTFTSLEYKQDPKRRWGLWIVQSDEDLINSREKGEFVIQFALSLYWLIDKVVGKKISEQLYVLLNEKLSWIKLP